MRTSRLSPTSLQVLGERSTSLGRSSSLAARIPSHHAAVELALGDQRLKFMRRCTRLGDVVAEYLGHRAGYGHSRAPGNEPLHNVDDLRRPTRG